MSNKRHMHRKPINPLVRVPKQTKPGAFNKNIIAKGIDDEGGRETELHATKGYRNRRGRV